MDDEDKKMSEFEEDINEDLKENEEDEIENKEELNKGDDNSKENNSYYNKILGGFLIVIAVILVVIVSFGIFSHKINNFNYNGLKFNVLKEGDVKFYHTSFVINKITETKNSDIPVKQTIDYNVFLRKDPRDLEKIPFNGEMNQREMMVINMSDEFNCKGDGVIAIANMAQILTAVGTNVIRDPNATCDEQGRYMFVQLEKGEKTSIEQYGPACYKIKIKDCEVLEGTEKFVLEMFKSFSPEQKEKFEVVTS